MIIFSDYLPMPTHPWFSEKIKKRPSFFNFFHINDKYIWFSWMSYLLPLTLTFPRKFKIAQHFQILSCIRFFAYALFQKKKRKKKKKKQHFKHSLTTQPTHFSTTTQFFYLLTFSFSDILKIFLGNISYWLPRFWHFLTFNCYSSSMCSTHTPNSQERKLQYIQHTLLTNCACTTNTTVQQACAPHWLHIYH